MLQQILQDLLDIDMIITFGSAIKYTTIGGIRRRNAFKLALN